MNKEDLEYERKYSHSHCWNQGKSPACGQPLKNHKQCCLCDTVYKPRKRFPSQPNSEDGKMMYGHSSGNEVQFSHSPKPEEKCPLGKGHKYSEICRVCTPLPDTTEEKTYTVDPGTKTFGYTHTSNEWEPIAYGKNISEVRQILAQYLPEWKNKMLCDLAELVSQSEQRVRKEMVELLGKHNARILNYFQQQGTPDMPMIAYDERVCLIPAIKKATKETCDIINLISK